MGHAGLGCERCLDRPLVHGLLVGFPGGPLPGIRTAFWPYQQVVGVRGCHHHRRPAYIGLIVPSGLWLGKVAEQRHSRLRGRWRPEAEKLAGWLTFFVRRMDDRIGDDLEVWCDERLRAACGSPAVLGQATIYYHERIVARWPKGDRRRQALDRAKDSILHKVGV